MTEELPTMRPSHRPARVSTTISIILGLMAVALSVIFVPLFTLPIAGAGIAALAVGLMAGTRKLVDIGAMLLLLAVIVSGLGGAPAELLLAASLMVVLSWDTGENAIGVGEQLSREASTTKLELVHVSVMTVVGIVASGVGYGAYRIAVGGQPVSVLLFAVLSIVVLGWALRR